MNFPIPVNLTVAQNNVPVNITVSDNSESIGLDIETQIVASVASEYEGPYTINPSESVQTLETDEKIMADNVTVGAIPSNYVGSAVPRKTSADLTASGPTVTAPAGYYAESASKTVQSGSVTIPNTTISLSYFNASINDSNGYVVVQASGNKTVTPTVTEGYISSVASKTMLAGGSGIGRVLTTAPAATITPTETEQIAAAKHIWTTGEIKVGAIPSSYVGSSVTRNDSTDLSVSGATVTAPAGYYENAASASVPNATWKSASTVGVVPEISVDSSGLITANCAGWTSIHPLTASGYADSETAANIQLSGVKTSQLSTQAAQTIIPNTADQTIAIGKYLTGAQTIKGDANLLAENIKKNVVLFNIRGTYEGGCKLTTKTITQNATYNAEDDGADGYSSVIVSVPQGIVVPSGFAFYNGYLLPEVKDLGDGYDYWWIRANGQTGNFDLIRGKSQWYVSSNSGLNAWSVAFANNTTLGSHQYSIPMDANEQSTPASDWGEVTVSYAATYGTGNNRKPIFTNVDIMIQGQSNICLRHGFPVVPNP